MFRVTFLQVFSQRGIFSETGTTLSTVPLKLNGMTLVQFAKATEGILP